MKKTTSCVMLAILALPLAFGGCAPRVGSGDYDATRTRTAQSVNYGTVESVRVVHIDDDSKTGAAVGTVGGGVAGGVLGSLIGSGRGRTLATVAGAALGAGAGYAGGTAMSGQEGYEIQVRLESGDTVVITQGTDVSFTPGQRVKVISGGGVTRVAPA